ncbi:MAG TPA: hypothetical protein VME46_14825 [Acidimicrobiales bacterium]|nr:hypothetical protein [Acidimicrobiales bacterium]
MEAGHLPQRVHEGIIVCSDRRLRPALDGLYNNGRRVIVSTAGSDVQAVAETVRHLTSQGVKRWTVLTHGDSADASKGCGWAGRLEFEIRAELDKVPLPLKYIEPSQVARFIGLGHTTRAAIENHNLEVQKSALKAILAGTGGAVEHGAVLDTATMFTDDLLTPVLVITTPSTVKYSALIAPLNAHGGSSVNRYNTYYSQVGHLKEARADARLFVALFHIRDVRLVSLTDAEHQVMAQWKARLAEEPFMRGVGLTHVALHHQHGGLSSVLPHSRSPREG